MHTAYNLENLILNVTGCGFQEQKHGVMGSKVPYTARKSAHRYSGDGRRAAER